MHKNTNRSRKTALGTCLLSTLVLSTLSAQERPRAYPSDVRIRSAPVALQCRPDFQIADGSVLIEEAPEPVLVHSLSKAELSSLENEASGKSREAGGLTLILAGAVRTHIGDAQAQNGPGCAVVESVMIRPVKEITVYVASEYAPGSCNFDAIKHHEDEHVEIARRLVTAYRPRLLRAVTGLRRQSPAVEDNLTASDVLSAVQGVINDLQREMADANRLLDERDTAKTLRKCTSW